MGACADISEGEVAATLSETLEVGDIALIRVEVEKKAINLRAAVRFRRGHFCGFEFLAMSLDQREAIKSLSERLRSIPVVNPNREP